MNEDLFFTYDGYKEVIKKISEKWILKSFESASGITQNENVAIIRHDVDFSIKSAYTLAQNELDMNVTSTYLFRVCSDTYNVCSRINRNMLVELSENGFEIGLHYDPQIYDNGLANIDNEVKILEDIIGKKISVVSFHNPSIKGEIPKVNNFISTYNPIFFNTDNYFSDSCKSFRGKSIDNFINEKHIGIVQFLFHPLHYNNRNKKYGDIFFDFIKDFAIDIDNEYSVNKTYAKEGNILINKMDKL